MSTITTASCLIALLALVPADGARFEIPHRDVLIDESISIAVTGLPPKATVTIHVRGGERNEWTSSAAFVADDSGHLDLTTTAPVRGSYKEVDAMGLFWSMDRHRGSDQPPAAEDDGDGEAGTPESWTLTAEVAGQTVAQTSVRRRAVSEGVRVAALHEDGLEGTRRASAGRHLSTIVLLIRGGIPWPVRLPAASPARRTPALGVLGVALPAILPNIPLEYFGTAINWLAAQPSVDPNRVGIIGASRGAELALLLGGLYPRLRVVVAYMPSHVVVRGCCDPRTWFFAWTLGGRPIAAMPPPGRRDPVEAQHAEIQVERIHGPILLVSGKDDGVWPSAESAAKIVVRLQQHHFAFPYESLVYDHAGHSITRPYTPTTNLNGRRNPQSGRLVNRGGTPAGTEKAREDSWGKMLAFVDRALTAETHP